MVDPEDVCRHFPCNFLPKSVPIFALTSFASFHMRLFPMISSDLCEKNMNIGAMKTNAAKIGKETAETWFYTFQIKVGLHVFFGIFG